MTEHFRSQGLTLQSAVVDFGDREFSAGLAYVALSRLISFDGLGIFRDFPLSRLTNKRAHQSRLLEEHRLQQMSKQTYDHYQHILANFD